MTSAPDNVNLKIQYVLRVCEDYVVDVGFLLFVFVGIVPFCPAFQLLDVQETQIVFL